MKSLLFALVVCASLARDGKAVALPPEALANFAWFDTLDLPDPRGCPVVHVATGHFVTFGANVSRNNYLDGFLLPRQEDGHFQVLAIDSLSFTDGFEILVHDLVETPPGTPEYRRVGYEPTTLPATVKACFDTSENSLSSERLSNFPFLKDESTQLLWRFFWAWACWRSGLDEQAASLYEAIPPSLRSSDYNKRNEPPVTVRAVLEDGFGRAVYGIAVRELGDPQIPRARLIGAFLRVGQLCPATAWAAKAKITAEALRAMVAEDARHPVSPAVLLADPPAEGSARELVYCLRDQTIDLPSVNTYPLKYLVDPFSPAGRLAALRLKAVPALLEALDDPRPTRSGELLYPMKAYYNICPSFVSIGGFALRILEEISSRKFYCPSGEAVPPETWQAVRDWWAAVQAKGEPRVLCETVLAHGRDADEAARMLIEHYPATALVFRPFIQAAMRTNTPMPTEEEEEAPQNTP